MKRLAIVGAGKITRHNAPFNDKAFEIWGIHKHMKAPWMKRCDVGIEVHSESDIKMSSSIGIPNDEYLEWLYKTDMLIYVAYLTGLKNQMQYPLEEIKEYLLSNILVIGNKINNFTSSIDYALALGIYEGYEQIDIYGAPMRNRGEYTDQRPGLAFWVGLAVGKGVNMNIMYENDLFNKPLYGAL